MPSCTSSCHLLIFIWEECLMRFPLPVYLSTFRGRVVLSINPSNKVSFVQSWIVRVQPGRNLEWSWDGTRWLEVVCVEHFIHLIPKWDIFREQLELVLLPDWDGTRYEQPLSHADGRRMRGTLEWSLLPVRKSNIWYHRLRVPGFQWHHHPHSVHVI